MRRFVPVLSTFAIVGLYFLVHPVPGAAQAKTADAVIAAARTALGGEAKIAAVKTFIATGRTKQVRGENLVPIEFEIQVELPDKYVRKDEIPAQESGPTSTGFNGDDLIQLPVPTPPAAPPAAQGRSGGPPPVPSHAMLDAARNARVATVKQDFARLTLGMFAASFSSYPLTFTYVGQAEAPQGKADVLEAKAPPNFSLRLFINSQTHLPIMVSWQQAPGRAGGGRGRGEGPPPEGRGQGEAAMAGRSAAPPAQVEYRIYYADYREVDGLQWPFRLRRATGSDTTEETTFDRFRINTKIDARKFEVRK